MSNPEIADLEEFRRGYDSAQWQNGLVRKGDEETIVGDERNVLQALRTAPELRGLVQRNEFALTVELTRAPPWRVTAGRWTDDDTTQLQAWLQGQAIAVRGRNVVADCISVVAAERTVHPVREYLHALEWDGEPRLNLWLEAYLGAQGNERYLSAAGRCWAVSAVARVERPGCQADHGIVLEQKQGAGKSTAARILAVKPEWFADSVGDVRSKDAAIQLAGKWLIELAELAAVGRAEIEAVKAYLSRTQDTFRPPYARSAVTIPRQCVFLGTTNEGFYLRDRTGNRRYWPVRCGAIDLEALARERDQLWAEALHAYRQGEQWHLDRETTLLAEAEQEQRVLVTELETDVAEFLDRLADDGAVEVTTRDVFVRALGLDASKPTYVEQTVRLGAQVAAAIERAGWKRAAVVGRAKTRRVIYRRSTCS
jgi:putative DNA primase/helicase